LLQLRRLEFRSGQIGGWSRSGTRMSPRGPAKTETDDPVRRSQYLRPSATRP
jgi:hypothetical protein